jgi:hypothetical protein
MWYVKNFFNAEKQKMIEAKERTGMEKIRQLTDDTIMPPLRG